MKLKTLHQFWRLLTASSKWQLVELQVLSIVVALFQALGVASLAPFIQVASDFAGVPANPGWIGQAYRYSGCGSPRQFVVWMALALAGIVTGGALLSILCTYRTACFGFGLGGGLAIRGFRHYMGQGWLYHAKRHSADMTNQLLGEFPVLVSGLVLPAINFITYSALTLSLGVLIILFSPWGSVLSILIVGIAYACIFFALRPLIASSNGRRTSAALARIRVLSDAFGGIRELILKDRQGMAIAAFERAENQWDKAMIRLNSAAQIPRHAIELLLMLMVIGAVLIFVLAGSERLGDTIPVLAVLALAGFRLILASQHIYLNLVYVHGHWDALESAITEMKEYENAAPMAAGPIAGGGGLQGGILLEGVSFTYPGNPSPALRHVSMEISQNQVVGIIGPSGGGKSTLIDLLMGLLAPDEGLICIGGNELAGEAVGRWRQTVGFVPQSIYLADASIRSNIAFGIAEERIDDARVVRAVELAHLGELVAGLPDGIKTWVGERGVRLSGGQRQRLGIARALYDDPSVLILDEATSALDGISERAVMEAIHDFGGRKTIIMIAHRLTTVRACDVIYLIDGGTVADHGTYDELHARSALFRSMAGHQDADAGH